jgi:hypothetical protein
VGSRHASLKCRGGVAKIQPRSPFFLAAWTVFDFDQISTRPESAKGLTVCCKLWRKRHASDGQSDSAGCSRCWPRGHSCGVAIGNTGGEWLRLARLNGARRLQLAARNPVCDSPHEQDDQQANRDVIGSYQRSSCADKKSPAASKSWGGAVPR